MSLDLRQDLLRRLWHELVQMETSAELHCRREARRLGDVPPARALGAVSMHASRVLRTLPELGRRAALPRYALGPSIEVFFSDLRDKLADRTFDQERSYRRTLLGLRHGVDLVRLMQRVAGSDALESFCGEWLSTRTPLIQCADDELAWFAEHVERAVSPASYWVQRALGFAVP
jgi:hypothetical protein